jgi:hypothetical protein
MSLLTELQEVVKWLADQSPAPSPVAGLTPAQWDDIAGHLHDAAAGLCEANARWDKGVDDVAGQFALDLAREADDLSLRARFLGSGKAPKAKPVPKESAQGAVDAAEEQAHNALQVLLGVAGADETTTRFGGDVEILQAMILSLRPLMEN